jgi:hypothetical protein
MKGRVGMVNKGFREVRGLKAAAVAAVGAMVCLALTGCAGDSPRAAEHRKVLQDIQAIAVEEGLTPGGIEEVCAVFDCGTYDSFESTTYITGPELTDIIMCERFEALAVRLDYVDSWRDMHPEEQPGSQIPDLQAACVESLAVNAGTGNTSQSEGVVFTGAAETATSPVSFWVQINSVNQPDGAPVGERGYYFLMSTIE